MGLKFDVGPIIFITVTAFLLFGWVARGTFMKKKDKEGDSDGES